MHKQTKYPNHPYLKLYLRLSICILILVFYACNNTSTEPEKDEYGSIVEGVNLDSLFAEPTAEEIVTVMSDWNSRTFAPNSIQIVDSIVYPADSTRLKIFILSQKIDDFTHYSIGIRPAQVAAKQIPLMMYCHGGDNGISVEETIGITEQLLSENEEFFILAPSFRSETVRYDNKEWGSGGDPSTFNFDVDDALSLFDNCSDRFFEIDTSRTGVIGVSRGAGVALLMSIREPSIDMVVDYFGPANFISDWVRELTADILTGKAVDLPDADFLSSEYIQPLKSGKLSITEMRHQLLLRSPLYFHEYIPAIVIYHGRDDEIVPISQSEELIAALQTDNRLAEDFAYYLYNGLGHDQYTIIASILTMRTFISNHF